MGYLGALIASGLGRSQRSLGILFIALIVPFLMIKPVTGIDLEKKDALALIQKIPKVELHAHLDGAVWPATLMELSTVLAKGKFSDAEDLKKWLQAIPREGSFEALLEKFDYIIPLLKTSSSLERVTYEFLEDAWRENIIYIEFRFAPLYHVTDNLSLEQAVQAVLKGKNRAEKEFSLKSGLILCFHGRDKIEQQLRILQCAYKYRNKGVVGVDFLGDIMEDLNRDHARKIYAFIKKHHLNLTVHAGEVSSPAGIVRAVQELGAKRIGHGVRLGEDKEIYVWAKEKGVLLELCPTSNVRLGIIESYKKHPLPEYFRDGVNVSLNTDDRTIFNTTLTKEWLICQEEMGLGLEDLIQINYNALEGAFIDKKLKKQLKKQIAAGTASVLNALSR